jgi:hypothetical protein
MPRADYLAAMRCHHNPRDLLTDHQIDSICLGQGTESLTSQRVCHV